MPLLRPNGRSNFRFLLYKVHHELNFGTLCFGDLFQALKQRANRAGEKMGEDWGETGQESLSLSPFFFLFVWFLFRPSRLTESLEQASVLVTVN